jgi:putative membrane protein
MSFHWMDGSGFYWIFGLIPMLLWALLLVVGIILVLRLSARSGSDRMPPPQWGGGDSAEEILRRRFASGEIDEDEYRRRLDALRR